MSERRANIYRSILALGAMFGGMPIYDGMPRARPEPIVHPEARVIAIDLGVSYEDAERVWRRFGTERAREVLTVCREHGISPDNDLLRLFEPEPTTAEQMKALLSAQRGIDGFREAFKKEKAGPTSLLAPTVPEARQQRRSLAERKSRRAKRKQRGKR